MTALRERHLEETLARLGFQDTESCLRTLYHSRRLDFDTVRAELGIGRDRLRTLFKTARVQLRPPGVNTEAGRHARARLNDERAAARVGTNDLRQWLTDRQREGSPQARLAQAVGHSIPWVKPAWPA